MRKMMKFIIIIAVGMTFLSIQANAADQKVTLMLGGKSCASHQKEITDALMGVKGVKGVDLTSMKGHALVTHDGTVKAEALVDALAKNAKGSENGKEWSCTAEAM